MSSDDPAELLARAAGALGAPLGLVGSSGEPLGHAPDDDHGRRALAIARAAARHHLVAPPGWHIARLVHASTLLGFLAIGEDAYDDRVSAELCELLPALTADQLQRTALERGQRAAFERRLVTESELSADDVRRAAADVGITLPAAFWPAVLTWRHVPPAQTAVATVECRARRRASGAITVPVEGRLVLLHPSPDATPAGADSVWQWFGEAVTDARRLAPSARAHVIANPSAVEPELVGPAVALLAADARFAPRAEDLPPVISERRFVLDRLLSDRIAPAAGRAYVDDCIGRLVAWDAEHHTDLLAVLEAGLDFPRHDRAAQSCFMHRNTFRRRMRLALDVLEDDLDDPDVRLAVHVALKLRKVPLGPAPADALPGAERRGAPKARRRRDASPAGVRARR